MQGEEGELAALVPSMTDLDLSDNLVPGWQEVARLLTELPQLTGLNLSCNVFSAPASLLRPFPGLQILALNNCRLAWGQVHYLITITLMQVL